MVVNFSVDGVKYCRVLERRVENHTLPLLSFVFSVGVAAGMGYVKTSDSPVSLLMRPMPLPTNAVKYM